MTKVTIRMARAGEAGQLTALCKRSKAHWGYDEQFLRQSEQSLTVRPEQIETGRVLVAVGPADVAVGVAEIVPMKEPGIFDLDKFFIDPKTLRSGVGRELFCTVCQLASNEGAIRLMVLADPNAVGFYEKVGAVRVGDAPSDAIPGRMLPLFMFDLK